MKHATSEVMTALAATARRYYAEHKIMYCSSQSVNVIAAGEVFKRMSINKSHLHRVVLASDS